VCSEKPGDIVGIAFILGIKIERFAEACEFGRSKVYKETWDAKRGKVLSHAGRCSLFFPYSLVASSLYLTQRLRQLGSSSK